MGKLGKFGKLSFHFGDNWLKKKINNNQLLRQPVFSGCTVHIMSLWLWIFNVKVHLLDSLCLQQTSLNLNNTAPSFIFYLLSFTAHRGCTPWTIVTEGNTSPGLQDLCRISDRSNDSCTFSDTLIIKRDNLMILLRMRYLHAQHSSCMKKHKILSNPSMNSMPQGLLVWHSGGREDLIMYNVETMSQWTLDLAAICFERQPLRCSHLNAHTSWRCF